MALDPEPLAVLVIGLRPDLAAGAEALLAAHPRRVAVHAASLHDATNSGGGDAAVILVGVGTAAVDDEPLLVGLLRSDPVAPVVLLSELDDDTALLAALDRGAAGYLLAEVTGEELVAALERAAAGQTVADIAMGGRIASQLAHGTWRRQPIDGWDLRPRERQVLESLLAGRTNREIARELNLGEETVKTYLRTLYRKLGVRDRSQAIAIILRGH